MSKMTYDDFREKYGEAIKKLDNVYGKDKLNIFRILRLDNYEIRHSNFLIWLLKDDYFRKLFIRECCLIGEKCLNDNELGIMDINREDPFKEIDEHGRIILTDKDKKLYRLDGTEEVFEYVEEKNSDIVRKEYKKDIVDISKIDKPFQRYIDINIIGDCYTLTIENKVEATEHDRQCVAYRNYMECSYGNKKNYFVFLAKEKPDYYNEKNPESKYYKYIYVDYTQVKAILEKYAKQLKKSSIERKLVEQYTEIINAWNEFPEEYIKICKEIDLIPFKDNLGYKELLRIASTDTERDFIDTVHRYCEIDKKERDNCIKDILNNIVVDSAYIKDDYSKKRSKKKNKKENSGVQYAYALHMFSKDENEKSVIMGFDVDSDDDILQSIDYSAVDGIKIGIYSGMNSQRSRRLIKFVFKNQDRFIGDVHSLCKLGWECKLKCSFLKKHNNTSHTESNIIDEIDIDMKNIEDINSVLSQNDFDHIGDNYFEEALKYLCEIRAKGYGENIENTKKKIVEYVGKKVEERNKKSERKITEKDMKIVIHWIVCCSYNLKMNGSTVNMVVSESMDMICKELCLRTIEGLNIYKKGNKKLGDVYADKCFRPEIYKG